MSVSCNVSVFFHFSTLNIECLKVSSFEIVTPNFENSADFLLRVFDA